MHTNRYFPGLWISVQLKLSVKRKFISRGFSKNFDLLLGHDNEIFVWDLPLKGFLLFFFFNFLVVLHGYEYLFSIIRKNSWVLVLGLFFFPISLIHSLAILWGCCTVISRTIHITPHACS